MTMQRNKRTLFPDCLTRIFYLLVFSRLKRGNWHGFCWFFLFGFKVAVVNPSLEDFTSLQQVKVAHQYITTLIFDAPIQEVLIASKSYTANVNHRIVFLRSTIPNPLPTSMVVIFKKDNQIFNGLLSATNEPQAVYDFRSHIQADLPTKSTCPEDPEVMKKVVYLRKAAQDCTRVGVHKKYYDLILTNIFHDAHYTYIKVYIENKTALPFHLFETSFKHYNTRRSRIIVDPIYQDQEPLIPAYGAKKLIYILPRYTTHSSGKLHISFIEEAGSRVLNLSIPARLILRAKYYG